MRNVQTVIFRKSPMCYMSNFTGGCILRFFLSTDFSGKSAKHAVDLDKDFIKL